MLCRKLVEKKRIEREREKKGRRERKKGGNKKEGRKERERKRELMLTGDNSEDLSEKFQNTEKKQNQIWAT